jgi:hypothetical protein
MLMIERSTLSALLLVAFLFKESSSFLVSQNFRLESSLRAGEMCPEIPLTPRPGIEIALVATG